MKHFQNNLPQSEIFETSRHLKYIVTKDTENLEKSTHGMRPKIRIGYLSAPSSQISTPDTVLKTDMILLSVF